MKLKTKAMLFGGLFACTAIATSCTKEETAETPTVQQQEEETPNNSNLSVPATETEFVALFAGDTERSWEASEFTIAGMSGFQDCRLDDTMQINADGTYVYDGGANLCGAEDSQTTKNGTWIITENQTKIVFDAGSNNEYTATLEGISDTEVLMTGSYMGMTIEGRYAR